MRQDFAEIDDTHSLINIPPGQYPCQLVETRVDLSRDGSPRWGIQWRILVGELAGKTAAWDNLHWSERGLPRVKLVLAVLGYDVSGVIELEPEDLIGRRALVRVEKEVYEEPHTGRRVERLTVPYRGYDVLPEGEDEEIDFLTDKGATESAVSEREEDDGGEGFGEMPF